LGTKVIGAWLILAERWLSGAWSSKRRVGLTPRPCSSWRC